MYNNTQAQCINNRQAEYIIMHYKYIFESQVEHPHHNRQADGRIYDFCDSEAFRNHPLFSRDPLALQILMYYDNVEVVNPLGSKTKKHKQGI